ncbi:MAG: glucose 1-dehydrogenase [Halieaceae bacterium]|nr:glucose 1-dehydrogenase [Halieaceae bacterium]
MTTQRLQSKVALITGATSGIGRCTAERMVAEGASVVLCGRRKTLGEQIAAQLGDAALFMEVDVTEEGQVQQAVNCARDQFGKLDILFNNAGGPAPPGDIAGIESEDFDASVALLLRSVFYGIKHAAPVMCAQGSGAIVSNASVAAQLGGYATSHLYAALKAAVVQLAKSVALELAESGVRINTVSPGAIATGIFGRGAGLDSDAADATSDKVRSALKKAQPLGRAGTPEDVANAVIFLASDEAGFITGRDLVIDGGAIAGRPYTQARTQRQALQSYLKE